MGKIRNKLNSQSGETIGETLVATLIAALALVMLAGAVSSGSNIILESKDKMNEYYDAINDISSGVGTSTSLTVSLKQKEEVGLEEEVYLTDASPLSVNAFSNSIFSNTEVISYSE